MKKEMVSLMVLFAVCVPALAADVPDLVGNWTGNLSSVTWFKNTHYLAFEEPRYSEEKNLLVIEEQNGTRFAGRLFSSINPKASVAVLGVIASDNESLTLVDEDGSLWGYLTSPTEMELFDQELCMDTIHVGGGILTKE